MKGFKLTFSKVVQYWRDSASFKQAGIDITEANGIVYFTPIRPDGFSPTIKVGLPVQDVPALIECLRKGHNS
jgi:hypothetical protein